MKTKSLKWTRKLVILSALVFLCGMSRAEAASLTVGSGKAQPGETVAIPVDLANAGASISGLSFRLRYDSSQLSFSQASPGQILTDAEKTLTTSEPTIGELRFIIFGLNQNVIADGTLIDLSFIIKPEASAGETALTLNNASATDPQAEKVPLTLVNGKIIVDIPIPGDLDNNGTAGCFNDFILFGANYGLTTGFNPQGDMDKDQDVDIDDFILFGQIWQGC